MKKIKVPKNYMYIAAFLSMRCGLSCSYCINAFDKPFSRKYTEMSTDEWIEAINRLDLPEGLPVTLQGGEATFRKDFIEILEGIRKDIPLDILTNAQFDINRFIKEIPPNRFRKFEIGEALCSVRVSYHPEQMDMEDTIQRVLKLKEANFNAGISMVDHPSMIDAVTMMKKRCKEEGIVFWSKEFLGFHRGKLYGTYKYPEAVNPKGKHKMVECKISELLIAPDGDIYRCHRDLYHQENPIGHILDPDFKIEDIFRSCDKFGECNPCDTKKKLNRFLKPNYTSVEIRGAE